jgi:hypothetical protein
MWFRGMQVHHGSSRRFGAVAGLRPEIDAGALRPFRERMYSSDFVFNVSREFVRGCAIPLLVLMGNDIYHPSETSREIVALAPRAELIERWKEPERLGETVSRVRDFLQAHTPIG